jgi:hypothetical protein
VITRNNTAAPKKMKYTFCGGSLDSFSSDIIVHYSKGESNHHFNILRDMYGILLNHRRPMNGSSNRIAHNGIKSIVALSSIQRRRGHSLIMHNGAINGTNHRGVAKKFQHANQIIAIAKVENIITCLSSNPFLSPA